jgi:hypothetical protein
MNAATLPQLWLRFTTIVFLLLALCLCAFVKCDEATDFFEHHPLPAQAPQLKLYPKCPHAQCISAALCY